MLQLSGRLLRTKSRIQTISSFQSRVLDLDVMEDASFLFMLNLKVIIWMEVSHRDVCFALEIHHFELVDLLVLLRSTRGDSGICGVGI